VTYWINIGPWSVVGSVHEPLYWREHSLLNGTVQVRPRPQAAKTAG
jgi:hypothetical protein